MLITVLVNNTFRLCTWLKPLEQALGTQGPLVQNVSECLWFMRDAHLATFFGSESELVADQYRWFVIFLCHFSMKLQSFS